MARLVKCQLCGNKISNDIAYKVAINKENTRFKYYCSENEYVEFIKIEEEKVKDSEKYSNLMKYIMDELLGYEKGMLFPTTLVKRIKKLRQFYTYEVIKETFIQSKDTIVWAVNNKGFESEFGMTSYIMAIVESKVNDVYKIQRVREEIEKRNAAKSLDTNLMNDIEMVAPIVKRKEKESIMSFLGEDEI